MPVERLLVFSRMYVPQPNGIIFTPTSKCIAIGIEHHAFDPTLMPGEHSQVFSRICVPQPDNTARTSASERVTIGAKRNTSDRSCMPVERLLMFSGVSVPKSDGVVTAPASERATIGAERNTNDPTRMSSEQSDFLMSRRIVELYADAAGNCKAGTVGRILYCTYYTFTEARLHALGQPPLRKILGGTVR